MCTTSKHKKKQMRFLVLLMVPVHEVKLILLVWEVFV